MVTLLTACWADGKSIFACCVRQADLCVSLNAVSFWRCWSCFIYSNSIQINLKSLIRFKCQLLEIKIMENKVQLKTIIPIKEYINLLTEIFTKSNIFRQNYAILLGAYIDKNNGHFTQKFVLWKYLNIFLISTIFCRTLKEINKLSSLITSEVLHLILSY
jgi:hypothetical protein